MSYTKTVWKDGDIIEADALNNIEDALEASSSVFDEFTVDSESNSMFIPKTLRTGVVGSSIWTGFESLRHLDEKQIQASYGVGSSGGEGFAQINWSDFTNNLNTRLLLNYDNFFSEYNNRVNLGKSTLKFKNGYFGGQVFMGNDSTVNELNSYCQLSFRNADNSVRYGFIGKVAANTDFIVSSGTGGNARLQCSGEGKAQLGTGTYGVELYQGSGAWYFAPYGTVNFQLGKSDNRFGTLYTTTAVNASSDKSLKENIEYVPVNKEVTTLSDNQTTTEDMYTFVKDDLKLANYNYIDSSETTLGFIAQDCLENERVGKEFIREDDNGLLSYDTMAYTNVLAGALQSALQKIESLEVRLSELEGK